MRCCLGKVCGRLGDWKCYLVGFARVRVAKRWIVLIMTYFESLAGLRSGDWICESALWVV